MKESGVEVVRKGTAPIFKYVLRGPRGWHAAVMIDDDAGDIQICFDGRHHFGHYWGPPGRGEGTLRKFLARAGKDYLGDKFSYGLSRWNGEKAMELVLDGIVDARRERTISKEEARDIWDEIEESGISDSNSSDGFYHILMGCDQYIKKILHNDWSDMPNGNGWANLDVENFLNMMWPAFVEHIKKELAEGL